MAFASYERSDQVLYLYWRGGRSWSADLHTQATLRVSCPDHFFSFCFVFFFFFMNPLVEAWGKTGNGQKPALILALSETVNCHDSPHLAFKKWLKCQLFSPTELLWLPVFPFDYLPDMKWFMCVSLLGRFYAVDLSVLSGLSTSALWGGPKWVWFWRSSSFILLLEWEKLSLTISVFRHTWNYTSVLWNPCLLLLASGHFMNSFRGWQALWGH